MSEFKATQSQQRAIDTRCGAVLVSAGAGSGKTRVLTERLMKYICDPDRPADVDSFLIITFTRAAAGELRGRISEELGLRLAADPANKRLRRQNALCSRAQIGTIHSFCAAVLREYSHILGISPDFKIIDDERGEAMKAAALERVLEGRYAEPEKYPGFTLLADTVGAGRDDSRLEALALELNEKMQSHPRPELWAQEQLRALREPACDAAETVWGREIINWAKGIVRYWIDEFEGFVSAVEDDEKLRKAYYDSFSQTLEDLYELKRRLGVSWDSVAEMGKVNFPRLGSLRNDPDPEQTGMMKARREICKSTDMPKIFKTVSGSSEQLLRELSSTADAMEALLRLTLDFDAAFSADKKARGLMDYNDLEHYTARLLTEPDGTPTEIAAELSQRYTEIMVDEYQDVSRVQDAIFRAVSRNMTNLFMVGDVKQSIYRFRLAEPEIFNEKYRSFPDDEASPSGEPRRILLRENFRSRREIIEGANSVFGLCMSEQLGETDYDDAAALRLGAQYEGSVPVPEMVAVDVSDNDSEDGEEENAPDAARLEAEYVAGRIKAMVESGVTVTDHGVQRPMEYGDAAILLRSVSGVEEVYRRALMAQGVPAGSGQGSGFFSSVEVSAAVSMLALIDNPHQDIPLIAVLRSPAFGFSADELTWIRAADKRHDLFSALTLRAETDEKSRAFLGVLNELRQIAPDMGAAELVWAVLDRLDLPVLCSAMDDGEQRRARLLELVELGEKFEATGYRGVHRFVLWLKKLAEKGKEPGTGASTASAVHIMTVHKSKGLEFPVVFLCNTGRRFNQQDVRGTVLIHPELGLGPKYTDLQRRLTYPTLARNAIAMRMDNEMKSEEMRLLYVALTRAKERLIVTTTMKNPEKKLDGLRNNLTRPMPPEILRKCSCMADWMLYACLADEKRLHLTVVRPGTAEETAREEKSSTAAASEEDIARLRRNLAFRYGHGEAVSIPSKITATELKGRAEADSESYSAAPKKEFSFALPKISETERPLTAAEKGVATHLTLQYMDFSRADTAESIAGEVERLRQQGYLSAKEAQSVDVKAVRRLFASELGQRIRHADRLVREFKFSLLWDAGELDRAAAGDELLMQGVVDCCIFEGGSLTVIDYKTDRVRTEDEISARAELYRGQISAYAKAMERIFGMPVRECVLYFLSAGRAVSMTMNDGMQL